jgi:hypothetical protein
MNIIIIIFGNFEKKSLAIDNLKIDKHYAGSDSSGITYTIINRNNNNNALYPQNKKKKKK